MIAKHLPMRSLGKSDFAGLVKYITDAQGKTERLGDVRVTNCQADTMQAVIGEALATQRLNTRAENDKVFHLLVSFRSGEKPDLNTLKVIEERICAGLGYSDHQRVSAVHYDTDNFHIHIVVNKIHPTRLSMHEPFQSYRTLGKLCQALEVEFGLERDNHQTKRGISEGRAADMEQHSGIESLVGWIKRECLEAIRSAQSWADLHQIMRENGLNLRQRANGFVIEAGDGTIVKASTIARDLSKPKLEERLGVFEPILEQTERAKSQREYEKQPVRSRVNTADLYLKYQDEQRNLTDERFVVSNKLYNKKNNQIKAAKRSNKLWRAAIKLIGGTRLSKKILYAQAHKALCDKIQTINKQYQKDRSELYDQHKRRAWADWLKQKAMEGDKEALDALRARDAAKGLKGDTIKGEGEASHGDRFVTDNITKKGTILFRSKAGAVRDDGDKLQVSRQATMEAVQEALRLAVERYGHRIAVNGTPAFKAQVIRAAAASQIPVVLTDPALERRRQTLNNQEKEEKNHERSEQTKGDERGGVDRRSTGRPGSGSTADQHTSRARPTPGARSTHAAVHGQPKPNVGRIGRNPPPQSQHRLRTLSQLGVVRIADGTAMLLPRDVSHNMEQQATKPDNQLRWSVIGSSVSPEQVTAADKYIAEREKKRLSYHDILKHSRYDGQDGVSYAGTRNVEGHMLALLKKGDEILVLPIDQATAQRLKRVAVGDPVSVTSLGSIKMSKGRGR